MDFHARLKAAYDVARCDLLAERNAQGHWIGELSASALSTATAVSALVLISRHNSDGQSAEMQPLIEGGIAWLSTQQNSDGGFGDTDLSYSNISTTMLVQAALHLAGQAEQHADLLKRAGEYVQSKGGVDGLRRRYGKDKTFAVPILTNCALAGIVDWKEVSSLPFEAAWIPQRFYRFLGLPVVSYAIPALVAIGQAKFFERPSWNPWSLVRKAAVKPTLRVLEKIQPTSGGYLEAVPLTSFVSMSLAGTGRANHPVVQSGKRFLLDSVRPDGSWPIDTNLATWNTTLAINALVGGGEDVRQLDCLEWVLSCQYQEVHPYTGAAPGGWGWTDLSGAVPDADDTPSALLAIAHWHSHDATSDTDRKRIAIAAKQGCDWLLNLQNSDGGWPTFCRGWSNLPFDRSGADLTAHAIRALRVWQPQLGTTRWERAIDRGFTYLTKQQRDDGSWFPLWFGNQDHPEEENPVYGTSKVLLGYRDSGLLGDSEAQLGMRWLAEAQNSDGGWGGELSAKPAKSSVEETALAVDALLGGLPDASLQGVVSKGLEWLVQAVEEGAFRQNSPIGFYFAKLWYHERLYPRTFTVSALGHALARWQSLDHSEATTAHLPHA